MKCLYCEFETEELGEQESSDEMDKHLLEKHSETTIQEVVLLSILSIHTEFKKDIDTLISEYFEIRNKMSQEFRKRELKEKFGERR